MNIISTEFEENDKRIRTNHTIVEHVVNVHIHPSQTEGLTCKFSFENESNNDLDFPFYSHNAGPGIGINEDYQEFSKDNQEILEHFFKKTLKQKDKIIILEIGVQRNLYENSSTYIFIKNKRDNDIYLGIDIRDVSHLTNTSKNIYTIQTESQNIDIVMHTLENIGAKHIDVLMIDGWHSINQVYKEWEYTKYLSKDGIVIFHDTNAHPGPYFITKSIDTNLYEVNKYLNDIKDWGITICIKKS